MSDDIEDPDEVLLALNDAQSSADTLAQEALTVGEQANNLGRDAEELQAKGALLEHTASNVKW